MRIAICTTQVPFVSGRTELPAQHLKAALIEHGHEAEIVSMPLKWHPPDRLIQSMLLWRLIDLEDSAGTAIDRVIALDFPAYLITHPNKVVWLVHDEREAYSCGALAGLRENAEGARLREIIFEADNRSLQDAVRVFTKSRAVAERLRTYTNVDAVPLYCPPCRAEQVRDLTYGDYVFYPARLEPLKRQRLLIEAMSHVRSKAICILAGDGPDRQPLSAMIESRHLAERVHLLGPVSDNQFPALYNDALAIFFGPIGEDHDDVTLESFLAGKPVITLNDSAGPLEFVQDNVNGFVLPPDPREVAAKIDLLFEDRRRAMELGERGAMLARDEINWSNVVKRLMS